MSDPRAEAIRRLAEAGVDNPRLDVRVLWDQAQRNPGIFESYVKRRIAREPVAYIVGIKEFWSLEFAVEPGVLIPRPETETIVEQVLETFPDPASPLNVLDLGTGSGCLLAAILKEFPRAHGLGVDSSDKACSVASANIRALGLSERAQICHGGWDDEIAPGWDVIVSNPPYIKTGDLAELVPEVARYEPVGALDGGPDGLDSMRVLAKVFGGILTGTAFVEIGAGQAQEASSVFTAVGLEIVRNAPDLAGIPRVLVTGRRAKKVLE